MSNTRRDMRLDMVVLQSYLTSVGNKWIKSGAIYQWTGLSAVTVRRVCQAYPARFIAGSNGYKLTSWATRDEIQVCVAALLSRSDKMVQRASALSRRLVA